MKHDEIISIMEKFATLRLGKLSIETDSFKLSIDQQSETIVLPQVQASVPLTTQVAQAPQTTIVESSQESISSYKKIKTPLPGVFYRAASPEKPPFVKVGDMVSKGDIVCLVEAMKMINEIKSPYTGKIVKILPKNEQVISFDEVLFEVEPC